MQTLSVLMIAASLVATGPAPSPSRSPVIRPASETAGPGEVQRATEHKRDQIKAVIRTARKRGELSRHDAKALLRDARRANLTQFAELEMRIARRRVQ